MTTKTLLQYAIQYGYTGPAIHMENIKLPMLVMKLNRGVKRLGTVTIEETHSRYYEIENKLQCLKSNQEEEARLLKLQLNHCLGYMYALRDLEKAIEHFNGIPESIWDADDDVLFAELGKYGQ